MQNAELVRILQDLYPTKLFCCLFGIILSHEEGVRACMYIWYYQAIFEQSQAE